MENAQAITQDNSMTSNCEEQSLQSGGSYERAIVKNDSGGQSVQTVPSSQGSGLCPPMSPSPQRSNHSSVPHSPNMTSGQSPEPQIYTTTPQQLSPLPVESPRGEAGKIENPFDIPSLEHDYSNAILLGIQQLERQQAAMDKQQQQQQRSVMDQRKQQQTVVQTAIQQQQQQRHYAPPTHNNVPQQGQRTQAFENSYEDDDDHTEPSSTVSRNTGENPAGYTRTDTDAATSTFGKIIQNTRRRMSSADRKRSGSADEDDLLEGALIYGYLQKMGRNGKWQARWFETDGECLTYYKSSKRTTLLATLDLAKVGSIVINLEDPKGCEFTINISERPYHLRADGKGACKDWVITLNRVKEARMQEGNVKLVTGKGSSSSQPSDILGRHHKHKVTPRVVVVSNRQRTRAMDEESMINSWEQGGGWDENEQPSKSFKNYDVAPPASNRLAHWQKPRNSINRMASKLVRWARSLKKLSCENAENQVVLDHHVHPPGHDYKPKTVSAQQSPVGSQSSGKPEGHGAWIAKEAASGERSGPPVTTKNSLTEQEVAAVAAHQEDDEETRELS